jgi:predicted SAM-dependent methyltransferase
MLAFRCLDVGKHMGMDTSGIEPNRFVAEQARARGHEVFCLTLDTFSANDDRWHIITAYEVLEHQSCPEEFLLRCHDLLEPGGILAVVVPNDCSPLQYAAIKKLGISPWWYAPPQHLFYWTPKTLQLQMRRCGFTILDMRGTYPIDQALLNGQNYIGNDVLGREVHTQRMQWELDMVHQGQWSQVEDEYRSNLQCRIGREIVCIARKAG